MRRLTLLLTLAVALVVTALPSAGARESEPERHGNNEAGHHGNRDRDHDGMPNRFEHRHHVRAASADPDRDGVKNVGEFRNGTDPRDDDSDNDGIDDGDDDANDDGIEDRDEQAGTIASFDAATGVLTLTLVNGDTLKGMVNGDTEIKCRDAAAATRSGPGDDDPADHEAGDDANDDVGDDNGDDANDDVGDDNDDDANDNVGDDNGGHHGRHHGHRCSTDALVPGTAVREAELRTRSGGAVFHEIELSGKTSA